MTLNPLMALALTRRNKIFGRRHRKNLIRDFFFRDDVQFFFCDDVQKFFFPVTTSNFFSMTTSKVFFSRDRTLTIEASKAKNEVLKEVMNAPSRKKIWTCVREQFFWTSVTETVSDVRHEKKTLDVRHGKNFRTSVMEKHILEVRHGKKNWMDVQFFFRDGRPKCFFP